MITYSWPYPKPDTDEVRAACNELRRRLEGIPPYPQWRSDRMVAGEFVEWLLEQGWSPPPGESGEEIAHLRGLAKRVEAKARREQ